MACNRRVVQWPYCYELRTTFCCCWDFSRRRNNAAWSDGAVLPTGRVEDLCCRRRLQPRRKRRLKKCGEPRGGGGHSFWAGHWFGTCSSTTCCMKFTSNDQLSSFTKIAALGGLGKLCISKLLFLARKRPKMFEIFVTSTIHAFEWRVRILVRLDNFQESYDHIAERTTKQRKELYRNFVNRFSKIFNRR